MKLGEYIDSEYDNLACPHAVLSADGVGCDGLFFIHQPLLVRAFNDLRHEYGSPIAITSGFRCRRCQKALTENPWYKAALLSEHCFNAAYDIRPWERRRRPATAEGIADLKSKVAAFEKILDSRHPEIRIGVKLYDGMLLHMGVGFLLKPNPDQGNWREGGRF